MPGMSMLKFASRLALLTTCFVLSACARLAFLAANIPASFQDFTRISDVAYGAGKLKLDVYCPSTTKRGPVVVFVHGGGWNSGSKDEYKFVAATLTQQGWIAVLPDYRLYPQVKYPAFVNDVAAAVLWTHAHAAEYGGDPEQIFLMGHSAGAHIAMMIALNPSFLSDRPAWIKGVIGLAGPYDFLPFTRDYMNDLFGPGDQFAVSQPINFVRADAPPLLLLHGTEDTTVRPKNSINLAQAIRSIGGRAQLKLYDHVNHGDILAALSIPGRKRAPVVEDVRRFVEEVSGQSAASRDGRWKSSVFGQSAALD
jgi:acetyl esterase/lipase